MRAKSKKQRRFFAIAEHDPGASAEATKLSKTMTKDDLHDVASTKEKGLPIKVKAHGRHKAKKAAMPHVKGEHVHHLKYE